MESIELFLIIMGNELASVALDHSYFVSSSIIEKNVLPFVFFFPLMLPHDI